MMFKIFVSAGFLLAVAIGLATFTLAQVEPRLPANFSLQVNGQVRYADSKIPAENILVRIESFSGGLAGQMTTDRTGKFIFTGLRPEQYIVTIHAPGYFDVREAVNLVTANTAYINAMLVYDKSSFVNKRGNNTAPIGNNILVANIPIEAQNEYSKAKVLIDEGKKNKIDEAITHLEKAIRIHPTYLEAQLMLGLAYMDLQKWDKAEKALLAVTEINSEAATAYFALGEVYRREKKYQEAEKKLLDGIRLNGNSAEGHNTLAKLYWNIAPTSSNEEDFRDNLENCWKEVRKALELNPSLAEAHLLAGNVLLRARRAEDALVRFEEYLKLDPKGEFAADTKSLIQKIQQALAQTKKK